MELKKGYKQTEIGQIPSDWQLYPFKDVTNTLTCGVAATPKYVPEQFGKPFLSAQNVQNGKLVLDYYRFIDKELYLKLTKHNKPERGDILYTRVGAGIGEAAVVDTDLDFAIYVSLTLIKTKKDKLHPIFLNQLLNSSRYRTMARGGQLAGAGVQNLNVQVVRSFLIPIPEKKEQEAIANALSDADAYIESLEKLIAKKRLIKKGVMQELLTGKRRLSNFSKPWTKLKIGDLGIFLKGKGVKKDEAKSGSIPCIRYGEIYTDHNDLIRDFRSFISLEVSLQATKLKAGDILFAGSGETKEEIGKCVAYTFEREAFAGGDIVILRPTKADSIFLGYYFNSTQIVQQKSSRGQGDAVVHISSSALASIDICIPDEEEQQAIGQVLSDLDLDIIQAEYKLQKARLIKQGMMQELLTGRIRLV